MECYSLLGLTLVLGREVYAPPALLKLPDSCTETTKSTAPPEGTGLTHRQLEVLELLVRGLPNKSTARQLDLSEDTVKLHVSAILRSMGAQSRTEAVRNALQRGLCKQTGKTV